MALQALVLHTKGSKGMLMDVSFGVTDGSRPPCVLYENNDLQNAYSEGCIEQMEVATHLVWLSTGVIVHSAINNPGSYNYRDWQPYPYWFC